MTLEHAPEAGADDPAAEVTALIRAARSGDPVAAESLFEAVYRDLKRIARAKLGRHRQGATLDTTALVHEVYLRLSRPGNLELEDRTHFFSVAARAMRQILVDHARRRVADKRGGGMIPLALDEGLTAAAENQAEVMVGLDTALARLERLDARAARLVELRFFGGLTFEEVAAGMGVSDRTLKRDWKRAKAFLFRELDAQGIRP
jgi:RNA polymerase sigma factor (TIGR02999 family)